MECHICFNAVTTQCTECAVSMCNGCSITCDICGSDNCMECGDSCSLCNANVCLECKVYTQTCKCCKRDVGNTNALPLCINCIVKDWFSSDKAEGFWCDECSTLCKHDYKECNVQYILQSQKECPVCLDTFYDKPFRLQLCGVHKICNDCNYNTAHGCPVCKVGW